MKKLVAGKGWQTCFCVCTFLLFGLIAEAQSNDYWTPVNEESANRNTFEGKYRPKAYKLFHLDEDVLKTELANAPSKRISEKPSHTFIISIPNPEGEIEKFNIAEEVDGEPVMVRNTEIKPYRGQGLEDPSSKIGLVFSLFVSMQ